MSDRLSVSLQENLLVLLVYNAHAASLIRNSVEVRLFGNLHYREIVTRIYGYLDEYRQPPGDHLPDLLEDVLARNDANAHIYIDILNAIHMQHEQGVNEKYITDQLETFVRQQTLKTSVAAAAEAIQDGDLDAAEAAFSAGLKQRLTVFNPGSVFRDVARLGFTKEIRFNIIPTGIKELDMYGLGAARGEYHLFIAPPKRGKCIAADELVLLPDGSRKRIEDVVRDKDPRVLSINTQTGLFEQANVSEFWHNGKKQCVTLQTALGREITTTRNHLYLTPTGWKHVSQLKAGIDRIAIPSNLPGLGCAPFNLNKMRLLAYLIADGGLSKTGSPTYTKLDPIIRADFQHIVESVMGDKVSWVNERSCYIVTNNNDKNKHGHNNTKAWLENLELIGKKSNVKRVPACVFTYDNNTVAEFLKALISSDGSLDESRGQWRIEYSSASAALCKDIQHLLLRFGILARYKDLPVNFQGKQLHGYGRLTIGGHQVIKFFNAIYFIGKKEAKAEIAWAAMLRKELTPALPHKTRPFSSEAVFDLVKAIKPAGLKETYDLTCPMHENFLASDIVTHNSWWLTNVSKQALLSRHKVVVITLELSEQQWGQRMAQSIFSMTQRRAAVDVTRIHSDDLGRLLRFEHDKITGRMSFDNMDDLPKLDKRLGRLHVANNLIIKQFPAGSLTLRQLRGYLDTLEQTMNFVPDVLVIDYPDYMKIDPKNYRLEAADLHNEIRGIAVERNIPIFAASRSNREGAKAKLVTDTHSAEDFSRIYTADTVLTYSQTAKEKELGLARIFVGATRVGERDRFIVLISQAYKVGQFCLDSVLLGDSYEGHFETAYTNRPSITDEGKVDHDGE